MADTDPGEIVVGANGSVFTAPVGTPVPASINEALSDAFVDLGFVTEDGVKWTDGRSIEDIKAWQSFYPVRKVVSEKNGKLVFALMQWNGETVKLAYGGGEVTEPDPGAFRYTPPAPSELDERMTVVEWQDGDKDYRLIFPRGLVTDDVETQLVRTSEADLPITIELLGTEGEDAYILDTNDPSFEAAVAS